MTRRNLMYNKATTYLGTYNEKITAFKTYPPNFKGFQAKTKQKLYFLEFGPEWQPWSSMEVVLLYLAVPIGHSKLSLLRLQAPLWPQLVAAPGPRVSITRRLAYLTATSTLLFSLGKYADETLWSTPHLS